MLFFEYISETFLIEHKTKIYIRRAIKIVLWIFAGILALIILAVGALQFHAVQHFIAQRVVSIVSEKTQSRIEIGSVNIAFTHSVVLENVFVESQQHDTLLSIQSLAVDVNLLGLFSNEIILNNVRIDSLTAHISRRLPDSSFNFDFIINALSSNSTSAVNNLDTSTSSPWKIQIGKIHLYNIQGTYDDEVSGLNLRLHLGALDASVDKFDLGKMQFTILARGEVKITVQFHDWTDFVKNGNFEFPTALNKGAIVTVFGPLDVKQKTIDAHYVVW